MCGLVGVLSTEINSFQHSYGKFFKQALFADTLRGFDSTGIFVMDTKTMQQPEVFKKAIAAPDFLQLARTNDLLRDTRDWNIMIGHNRHATKGSVDHHTAHPFQIGDITLVHNGTINNHRVLLMVTSLTLIARLSVKLLMISVLRRWLRRLMGLLPLYGMTVETEV